MTPKPLSEAVRKGFAYLVNQQDPTGGWSQGGGWRSNADGGRVEGPNVEDPPDVANTCVAALALLRGEHSPRHGDYSGNVRRALDFVLGSVERADAESPYVTDLRGTQVQTKIGPYVDTFLAVLTLAEAKGQMPDPANEDRLAGALNKVIGKLERHQQADGTWAMHGWAPVVGQGLAAAGLNRARQRGAQVADEVLQRSEKHARGQYDRVAKRYSMEGSAGVPLYTTASHLSASSHTLGSYQAVKAKLRETMKRADAAADVQKQAADQLKYIEEAEVAHEESLGASYGYFKDSSFRQGFGSNGGEEFLSYLNISETLRAKGGKEWEDWDRSMAENLERIQNRDGSWSGHHCITGRTFCTATALLVLMADRAPRPEPVTV
jgi:Prenyltransferase and squalene oxidase repeat